MSFAPTAAEHMTGNPHYTNARQRLYSAELAEGQEGYDSHIAAAQAEATLALAFEQRSATLVAIRTDSRHGLVRSVQIIQDRLLSGLGLK